MKKQTNSEKSYKGIAFRKSLLIGFVVGAILTLFLLHDVSNLSTFDFDTFFRADDFISLVYIMFPVTLIVYPFIRHKEKKKAKRQAENLSQRIAKTTVSINQSSEQKEKEYENQNEIKTKNEKMIVEYTGGNMFFSDIVEQLGCGSWKISENSQLIYEISKGPFKIQFFTEKAKLSSGENNWDLSLTEFSKFSFKDFKEKDSDGSMIDMSKMFFDEKELYTTKAEKMQDFKSFAKKLAELFTDDIECCPKTQVHNLIDEFCIDAEDKYNADIYKALLVYKKRIETALNNGFLRENSKIITLVEENSGEIAGNLGQTAKKSLGRILSGGFSGLVSTGIDIAKAAGSRVAKGVVTDWSGKSFILLTNKNVILVKPDEINEYDFEDASDIFQARQDETLAGVVDIYDDCENKVFDNIAQTKWNVFKTQLRKAKKESENMAASTPIAANNEEDEFAEAEKKITKLKKMLDSGLISQEDFDAKKSDILASL